MLLFENQNIEFKQEYVPDIRKEVMGLQMRRVVRFMLASGKTVQFLVWEIQMV